MVESRSPAGSRRWKGVGTGRATSRSAPETRACQGKTLLGSTTLFLAGPVLPFVVAGLERLVGPGHYSTSPPPLPVDPLVEVIIPAYLESGTIGPTVERL